LSPLLNRLDIRSWPIDGGLDPDHHSAGRWCTGVRDIDGSYDLGGIAECFDLNRFHGCSIKAKCTFRN
jgi:hypothetical protein